MSEGGVGLVEREALDAARAEQTAAHQAYYRRLERIAHLDRLGVAHVTGDRSTARLLQENWRVDPATAGRWCDEAEDLAPRMTLHGQPVPPRLPCTATVLASGEISPEHVAIIRRTMKKIDRMEHVDPAEVPAADAYLAEKATLFPPATLRRLAEALLAKLDPDGAAPDEDADLFDDLTMTSGQTAPWRCGSGSHDAVDAESIREGIGVLATPTGSDDHRSLGNRQACAFKEVFADALGPNGLVTDTRHNEADNSGADAAAAADAEADDTEADDAAADEPDAVDAGEDAPLEDALIPAPRRPEPEPAAAPAPAPAPETNRGPGRALLTITMDHRWLQLAIGHGTLDSGALSDPATVRRWACDADIVPLVLGSKSEPLDIGRRSRLIPDAMRRALTFRDGGCTFPGCTRRPRRCHAHHIDHWGEGGPTCLDNLTLLCRHHHQVIHHGHWRIDMIDGLPWFTPPPWIDPERQPRPGGRSAAVI
ncbi:HNH endonuclease signature motif containing protein [Actinomycetospora sp. NBC_00405]|uniref:HNH endonuclease signature motif containing protein n=1 Tax=Actinomycetospora sp. NBC_00405 TaxID=2975952 RepID=UPI002E1B167C